MSETSSVFSTCRKQNHAPRQSSKKNPRKDKIVGCVDVKQVILREIVMLHRLVLMAFWFLPYGIGYGGSMERNQLYGGRLSSINMAKAVPGTLMRLTPHMKWESGDQSELYGQTPL
ncbi:hypothetical protein H5410_021188 [Solanum commersonii]|uniref:Uncharacterized protein n=1 Tax=Solanum commersonii TaxID=4109 RepID=A0A9J5ZA97_SOLCO|nr:hypothetical protein H5410_021188 [Solanum commersonii]